MDVNLKTTVNTIVLCYFPDMGSRDNIIVTGGAGYIGSHVCKALAKSGFSPITYDNLCSGNEAAVKWGAFERGDIRDKEKLSAVIKKYQPIAIMHFAGLMQIGDSIINPSEFYDNNVIGSYTLLEAAREHGINHMVFSSTASVYGRPKVEYIDETQPLSPINPYGRTKLAMEGMVKDFTSAYGMKHAILRYFNAAGADLDAETGTAYPHDTHLVPLLMQVAAGTLPQINIFGTDYDTPDGTALRDYIHVVDLAQAHVVSLQHILSDSTESITLNLGANKPHSVREVIDIAKKVTGKTLKTVECERRVGDPAILVADAKLAQKTLNWAPQYSDIDTIIETAWRWKKKQLGE